MNGKERRYFALTAFAGAALVGATAPWSGLVGAVSAANTPAAPGAASRWQYSSLTDELRATPSSRATIASENRANLAYPRGQVGGRLQLARKSDDQLTAALLLENGGLDCQDLGDAALRFRFDRGPIHRFGCTTVAVEATQVAAISDPHRLLAELRRASRTVVEADFLDGGRRHFVFRTAGLDWRAER